MNQNKSFLQLLFCEEFGHRNKKSANNAIWSERGQFQKSISVLSSQEMLRRNIFIIIWNKFSVHFLYLYDLNLTFLWVTMCHVFSRLSFCLVPFIDLFSDPEYWFKRLNNDRGMIGGTDGEAHKNGPFLLHYWIQLGPDVFIFFFQRVKIRISLSEDKMNMVSWH